MLQKKKFIQWCIYKGIGYRNFTMWHVPRKYNNEDAVYPFFFHSKRDIDFGVQLFLEQSVITKDCYKFQ